MSSQLNEFPIVLSSSRFGSFFSYNLCYKSERQYTQRLCFISSNPRSNFNINGKTIIIFKELYQQKMFSRYSANLYYPVCIRPSLTDVNRLILNKRDDLLGYFFFRKLTIVHIRILKNQFSLQWDLNLCPVPYRYNAFPAEIWSNLCTNFSLGKISSVNVKKCKM